MQSIMKRGNKKRKTADDEGNDLNDNNGSDDETGEAKADIDRNSQSINLSERADNLAQIMRQRESENKPCKKYSAYAINECSNLLTKAGPNQSSTTKLDQLNIHESLHKTYQKGDIQKCQLSFYLNVTKPLRARMLKHLNGEAGDDAVPVVYTQFA